MLRLPKSHSGLRKPVTNSLRLTQRTNSTDGKSQVVYRLDGPESAVGGVGFLATAQDTLQRNYVLTAILRINCQAYLHRLRKQTGQNPGIENLHITYLHLKIEQNNLQWNQVQMICLQYLSHDMMHISNLRRHLGV